jgi:hypothetical protein
MTNHKLTKIYQDEEDDRGSLVYTQENGDKTVTMTISVASDEQSHVTSHAHNLPVTEEAEHLQGIDLYHFTVTDRTQIQLTIEAPTGTKEAWYTVRPDEIVAESFPIEITLVRSDERVPFEYTYTNEALHESLTPYADQILDWSKDIKVQPLHHLNFDRKRLAGEGYEAICQH